MEAYRLHDLLVANRDPIYGYEPISGPRRPAETFRFGLLDLDPRSESYRENLALLLRWYPDAQIEDNVLLEQAKAADTLDERRAFLERCVRRFEGRDAVPEALYRLGLVYLERGRSADAESTLGRLMREFPDSIWAEEAAGLEAPRTAGANDVAAAGRAALHREGGR
ncbi:MAG: hypothetical protein D6788_07355 [Planctomycetota bacterium]|nr:MAG: hypothetical protein D6788_07355 [Planctomycetota bacterium]